MNEKEREHWDQVESGGRAWLTYQNAQIEARARALLLSLANSHRR